MTRANCHRVAEFRERGRVAQYREKLNAGELGYFAECEGRMVGSIWATINRRPHPVDVRGYLRLPPGEAVIHDIVAGVGSRGQSVGPFMTSRMIDVLITEHRVTRVLIDVRVTNASSNRMMAKLGLPKAETMLYMSALGKSVCRLRLRRAVGFHGSRGRP
jgi:ribosomal protein S18 acetylase RimI-like enzyme